VLGLRECVDGDNDGDDCECRGGGLEVKAKSDRRGSLRAKGMRWMAPWLGGFNLSECFSRSGY
jgi:hypothetical protein